MTDYRTILERDLERVTRPAGFTVDDVRRRRDRKRRNQRIAAGVVGMAVFVAAVWIVTSGAWFDRTETPAVTGPTDIEPTHNGPTYTLGPVTDEDIAVGDAFAQAWLAGDGEAAAAMFSPERTFDGFPPTILPALLDWLRAGGWTFESQGHCGV
ncbi:MAG: hypothetical protein WB297_11555, partial [Actinomycetota bacterium]